MLSSRIRKIPTRGTASDYWPKIQATLRLRLRLSSKLSKSIRTMPTLGISLARHTSQAKQFPQAIEAFEHALKINPLHASAEFGLSRAYQQSADTEHAREHLKKFQYITQNKIGAPMSLAYGEQGQYSRAVESPLMPLKPPAQIKVRFVDVTKEAGLSVTATVGDAQSFHGPGACFLDYDNDGTYRSAPYGQRRSRRDVAVPQSRARQI